VKLTKSYRSTFEIMQFAQAISPNPDLVAIERHGDAPQLVKCKSKAQELEHVFAAIARFAGSEHNTLGIILKTQKQAEKLFSAIQAAGHEARLLSEQSATFSSGIVVCTAHMAKGLEFDQVLIPYVDNKNYATMMDKNMLYVACTRAMHNLTLTYTDELTGFIAI
jgi:DNA helicase II / ATP-dependent DNA helicase PcrA